MTEAIPQSPDAPTPHRRPNYRRRRWVVGILAFLLVLLLAAIGLYWHLNSNIRSTDITRGGATNGDLTKAQPLNFLVLGSDTRSSSEDCKIGGGCSSASATASNGSAATGNADVEMLVHLSADRTHAQTVSIPRDTVVDIPECTDPSTGQTVAAHRARINSSMNYGPDCTVATVHQLTGLPIAHLAVIDFAGVVTMSNAIGGVNVCVDNDVYDPYSHLKLKKGSHTLQGQAALQFLRTRHAFGDGSDLGRTGAQHLFLSAMQRKMTSASTLVNPVTAYKLADAATKAVTVDKGWTASPNWSRRHTSSARFPTPAPRCSPCPRSPTRPTPPRCRRPARLSRSGTRWRRTGRSARRPGRRRPGHHHPGRRRPVRDLPDPLARHRPARVRRATRVQPPALQARARVRSTPRRTPAVPR